MLVAPSLSILGGQAVQADRLLRAWEGDPEVAASLLPVNPEAPGPLRRPAARQVRPHRGDAAGLLARRSCAGCATRTSSTCSPRPTSRSCWRRGPPCRSRGCSGKPVVMNYRSGEAPDHLARSAGCAPHAGRCRPERRAVALSAGRVRGVRDLRRASSRTSSISSGSAFASGGRSARAWSRRATSNRSTTSPARCARFGWCRTAIRTPR